MWYLRRSSVSQSKGSLPLSRHDAGEEVSSTWNAVQHHNNYARHIACHNSIHCHVHVHAHMYKWTLIHAKHCTHTAHGIIFAAKFPSSILFYMHSPPGFLFISGIHCKFIMIVVCRVIHRKTQDMRVCASNVLGRRVCTLTINCSWWWRWWWWLVRFTNSSKESWYFFTTSVFCKNKLLFPSKFAYTSIGIYHT